MHECVSRAVATELGFVANTCREVNLFPATGEPGESCICGGADDCNVVDVVWSNTKRNETLPIQGNALMQFTCFRTQVLRGRIPAGGAEERPERDEVREGSQPLLQGHRR